MLKLPYYYDNLFLDSLFFIKALNYKYYSKSYLYFQNIELIKKKIIKQFFKKPYKLIKRPLELNRTELYFDSYYVFDYILADFFLGNAKQLNNGFSFQLKQKYFINDKNIQHDFIDKYFFFKHTKSYVSQLYSAFTTLATKKHKHKTLILLKAIRGGFSVITRGIVGFLPINHVPKLNKKTFNTIICNSFYNVATIAYYSSVFKLKTTFFLKFRRKKRKKIKAGNKKPRKSKLKKKPLKKKSSIKFFVIFLLKKQKQKKFMLAIK